MRTATQNRIHNQAQSGITRYRDSEVARGLFNGCLLGLICWAGFYGFIRLMVGIFGSGK